MKKKKPDDSLFYEMIQQNILNGVYAEENLTFWEKIFRVSYHHNMFGIYRDIYVFNKRVHCRLVCRYSYS